MSSILAGKFIKSIVGYFMILFAQVDPSNLVNGQSIISQGFDQLFSIGLLIVGLIMIWRAMKEANEYNKKRDEDFINVIERVTTALENSNRALEKSNELLERRNNQS